MKINKLAIQEKLILESNLIKHSQKFSLLEKRLISSILKENEKKIITEQFDWLGDVFDYFGEGLYSAVSDYFADIIIEKLGLEQEGVLANVVKKVIGQFGYEFIKSYMSGTKEETCRKVARALSKALLKSLLEVSILSRFGKAVANSLGAEPNGIAEKGIINGFSTFITNQAMQIEFIKNMEKSIGDFICRVDLGNILKGFSEEIPTNQEDNTQG